MSYESEFDDVSFISDSDNEKCIVLNDSDKLDDCDDLPTNFSNIAVLLSNIKKTISDKICFMNVSLIAEIVDIREYKSMLFIKLKDNSATISAILFKKNYITILNSGDKIRIKSYVDVYNGQIQLNITSYQQIGIGENNINLHKLKNRLAKLGYFDKKIELKNNYVNIGVVTSLNAAGLKDFLYIFNKRYSNKKIYIYPSIVQGKDAVDEIIKSINLANDHKYVEIIVLIRGGGAKEDLECFNSEKLAIAIHNSKIPIVTGIGHQIDKSIADMVCVKAFITPTAVAQGIAKENIISNQIISERILTAEQKIKNYVDNMYQYITNNKIKLINFQKEIVNYYNNIIDVHKKNINFMKQKIVSTLNIEIDYINEIESKLTSIILTHCENLANCFDNYQKKIELKISKCDHKLKMYDLDIKRISQPKIFDKNDKEILSKKNLIKGEIYQLHFLDGICDIKI